ncbi:cytidine deaminase [Lacticaseibacillus mingshuiensis]|uniref:Cytidine deaminase n=1 Tax=Lacticaseibacillus mingshuiensis TaxID=2799574 RepID=A0ABW4CFE2_9LACO|nr:cytidine deaminase [Lacticaseibacillus mingshuiensis]
MKNELIAAATAARQNAYVPYSHFAVGAALITDDGRVVAGCNVENASFGLTLCAERNAMFAAVAGGSTHFQALAIIADTPGPVSPCGACRQVMAEFMASDAPVYLTNLHGDTTETTVGALLPGAFDKEDMTRD